MNDRDWYDLRIDSQDIAVLKVRIRKKLPKAITVACKCSATSRTAKWSAYLDR